MDRQLRCPTAAAANSWAQLLAVSRGTGYVVYLGDLKANVYAVDVESGALIWKKSAETHPLARVTGAPALYNGRLYVPVASFEEGSGPNPKYECCTFRGSVVAYDAM